MNELIQQLQNLVDNAIAVLTSGGQVGDAVGILRQVEQLLDRLAQLSATPQPSAPRLAPASAPIELGPVRSGGTPAMAPQDAQRAAQIAQAAFAGRTITPDDIDVLAQAIFVEMCGLPHPQTPEQAYQQAQAFFRARFAQRSARQQAAQQQQQGF